MPACAYERGKRFCPECPDREGCEEKEHVMSASGVMSAEPTEAEKAWDGKLALLTRYAKCERLNNFPGELIRWCVNEIHRLKGNEAGVIEFNETLKAENERLRKAAATVCGVMRDRGCGMRLVDAINQLRVVVRGETEAEKEARLPTEKDMKEMFRS